MNDHADTLRAIRAHYDQMRVPEAAPSIAALDAAIAALEAGRSGEAGLAVSVAMRALEDVGDTIHDARMKLSAIRLPAARADLTTCRVPHFNHQPCHNCDAPPQQPPPVGVTVYQVRSHSIKQGWSPWKEVTKEQFDAVNAAIEGGAASETRILSHQQPAPSVSDAVCGVCGKTKDAHIVPENFKPAVSEPAASGGEDALVERIIEQTGRENSIDGMDGDSWDRLLVRAALAEARRLTTTGQGDVERLVEAARAVLDSWANDGCCANVVDGRAMNRLDEALAPFGQQQEGQG